MRHARDFHVIHADDDRPGRAPTGRCPYAARQDGKQAGGEGGYTHIFGVVGPGAQPGMAAILALAAAMKARPYASGDSDIPAGYTYLGQFIFHDITAMMPGDSAQFPRNGRSPALDLDSVLPGLKPVEFPDLCGEDGLLDIGFTTERALLEDIPRNGRRPLIADLRNDDFLPLAQSHLLLIKFYNAVARHLGHDGSGREEGWWREARKTWLQHFQSVVLHDYLPRIVDAGTYRDVMERGRRLVRPSGVRGDDAWLPIEFAAAAGRFGHSMIRPFYTPWSRPLAWTVVTVRDFIRFSYVNSGDEMEEGVPFLWATDWRSFFELADPADAREPIRAASIDTHLAPLLHELPSRLRSDMADAMRVAATFSLAASTMNRGCELGIAPAQKALAAADELLGEPVARVAPEDIFGSAGGLGDVASAFPELVASTPLWFYVLREAELLGMGRRLGPLGGRIVMETLHAAIEASGDSILRGGWKPTLPSVSGDRFAATDLVKFSTPETRF